jgi:hypothetical protein
MTLAIHNHDVYFTSKEKEKRSNPLYSMTKQLTENVRNNQATPWRRSTAKYM